MLLWTCGQLFCLEFDTYGLLEIQRAGITCRFSSKCRWLPKTSSLAAHVVLDFTQTILVVVKRSERHHLSYEPGHRGSRPRNCKLSLYSRIAMFSWEWEYRTKLRVWSDQLMKTNFEFETPLHEARYDFCSTLPLKPWISLWRISTCSCGYTPVLRQMKHTRDVKLVTFKAN